MNLYLIRERENRFLKAKNLPRLCSLLKITKGRLSHLVNHIAYNEFYVRKSSGGKRLIEDPENFLQTHQDRLNDYLQAVYYLRRAKSAYGFQLSHNREKYPRNIKTNAGMHLGKPWMFNADFKDFFHQVTEHRLDTIFRSPPFEFDDEVIEVLIKLVSYKGRLPMGAPTSPVLSNMAANAMDIDYEGFADLHNMTYTRYADDLTFSAYNEFTPDQICEINTIAKIHRFMFNPDKFKLLRPEDSKSVTGIVVNEKLCLEQEYLDNLSEELRKYKITKELHAFNGVLGGDFLQKTEQQLLGHLQYVAFIYGQNHSQTQQLYDAFYDANYTDTHEVVSWLEVGVGHYAFFDKNRK